MCIEKKISLQIIFIFLVSLGIALCFSSANAVEYGQMGGRPAHPDPNIPESDAWFIYSILPGQSKEDAVLVMNLYEQDWDAHVYAADSVRSAGGGFALKQESEDKQGVGSWVRFYPDPRPQFAEKFFEGDKKINEVCQGGKQRFEEEYKLEGNQVAELTSWCDGKRDLTVSLKSQERREIPFVIAIPESVDVGEHTGGILIQKINKDETQGQDGSRVMLTTRVGVRIYETVPGEIIKKLSFGDFSIKSNYSEFFFPWDDEKKAKLREYVISSVATNEGNSSVDFNEKIIISNKITGKEEMIEGRSFQVLRGDRFSSILAWKAPAFGLLSFKKQYEYIGSGGSTEVIVSEDISKCFIPWREIVFVSILLLVLMAIFFTWKYFQKKRYGGIGWESYEVGFGETIIALAQKFQVNWKVLAKTNKLKAPYLLEPGQAILVPPGFGGGDIDAGVKNNKEVVRETKKDKEVKVSSKAMKKTVFVKTEDQPGKDEQERQMKNMQMRLLSVLTILFTGVLILAVIVLLVFLSSGGKISITKNNDDKKNNITELVSEKPLESKDQQQTYSVEPKSENEPNKEDVDSEKELSVLVLNGGAVPGSAGKVKEIMEASGIKVLDARNAESRDNDGIKLYHIAEAKNAAEKIKKIFDEKDMTASLEESEKYKEEGDVVVILGK